MRLHYTAQNGIGFKTYTLLISEICLLMVSVYLAPQLIHDRKGNHGGKGTAIFIHLSVLTTLRGELHRLLH